jgi:hypothetical protein
VDPSATTADWIIAGGTALAAVGTVGALFVALRQIKTERDARQLQEADTRRKERREQAERVSAWLSGPDLETIQPVALLNGSSEPVYRAVVWMVFIQGAGPQTGKEAAALYREQGTWHFYSALSVIPPGRSYTSFGGGWGALSARPGVEVAFTDRAGIHWLRSADGVLNEIPEAPTDYYGLDGPHDWQVPEATPPEAPSLERSPLGFRDRTRVWTYRLRGLKRFSG